MNPGLELRADGERAVEIHRAGGGLLLRYVYRPDTAADESPRPYAHPVNTLAGELLTNFRPNDHRWHHGLNFTINGLSGHNFWGGGTYQKADGYRMRGDHGGQHHTAWLEKSATRLAHTLDWRVGATNELLLQEERALAFTITSPQVWTLRWTATLKNVTPRTLSLGQYHSNQGLTGSHYSGLQFRGARELLDDHLDDTIGIFAEGGLSGEKAVHGAPASWMEWHGQKDTTLRRVNIRFANHTGPLHWFVRRNNPLAALPFQYERDLPLAAGASLAVDHTLTFTDA
ncbi:MAG: PmoA family protein [bacterium]|nr:PmoA family protein [bacterium]MDI1336871.1 PmoA family protein [Lacunisphaera sp.]